MGVQTANPTGYGPICFRMYHQIYHIKRLTYHHMMSNNQVLENFQGVQNRIPQTHSQLFILYLKSQMIPATKIHSTLQRIHGIMTIISSWNFTQPSKYFFFQEEPSIEKIRSYLNLYSEDLVTRTLSVNLNS